tara:strand:+ start:113 stop:502 length:390 start_codon:yes stop_codon:yes gene_type:complete
MSIGLKGLINLQSQINRLEAQVNACCPGDEPGSSLCKFTSCEPGCPTPDGFPEDLTTIYIDPIAFEWAGCEDQIKVNFEWFPEGVEEPFVWCCCYTNSGTATEVEQTNYILSIDKDTGCEDDPCVDCNV